MDQSVINFAVYEDSIEYEGMAQVTLPDVTMLTQTVSGSGIGGNIEAIIMGHVVLDPADNQLHALSAEVVVERGEQHPDDLGAVGEVDVSDLALASAHRSGVDVVALCHVAVGCCGELSVDVNELHAVTLLSFWPYSVKIEGGRGKAPGSPLVRC